MAIALKHWRESASLIIASKKMAMKQSNPGLLKKLMKTQPDHIENKNEEFLRLLLLKRKPTNSFMPSMYVFPGGTSHKSDFSREWLDLIGCRNNNLSHLFSRGKTGSPIFSTIREPPFCDVPSEIALRITAIRETFEESGILLGRPMTDLQDLPLSSISAHPICSTYCNLPSQVSLEWRKQVISDSSNFILMCKELKMVPDIWSLYEWSNWLTPLLQKARFDTAFFLCCVDEAPLILDSNETEDGVWLSPSGTLKACLEKIVALAPPQLYELSRLLHFKTTDDLLSFTWGRSAHRVNRWMPVIYQCQDGLIFALPGDDLYPANPDLTGEITNGPLEKIESVSELRSLYPRQHCIVVYKNKQLSLYCNIKPNQYHILPREFNKI